MWLARIGGLFIIGGWIVLVAGILAGPFVGQVVGGFLLTAAVPFVAVGAALLAIVGGRPLQGRGIRVGLALLAVGLLLAWGSMMVAASLTYDPLESAPVIILLLVGAPVVAVGAIVTGISLLRGRGPVRVVGVLLVTGLLLLIAASILAGGGTASDPFLLVIRLLMVGGAAGFVLGATGIGILALVGDRAEPAATS